MFLHTISAKYRLAFWILALLCLGACGPQSASAPKNIFGPDNREAVDSTKKPYSAVGRLDSGCTATLIGRKLILTAAHCVVDNATGTVKPSLKYFRPAFSNGSSSEALWIDYAWIGSAKPEDERTKDWAILRLERAVGDTYGSWGLQEVDFAAGLPFTVNLVGYSSDRDQGKSASVHRGCYVHEVSEGRLFHDCDGAAGVSGGPIFKEYSGVPHIIGMTVSEFRRGATTSVTRESYDHDYANVGIPASGFAAVARTLVQTADVDIAAPQQAGVIERTNPNSRDTDPAPGQTPVPTPTPSPVPNPTPAPQPTRPWENAFEQQDLASKADLAQHNQEILMQLDLLRLDAQRFNQLANAYQDRALFDISQRIFLALDSYQGLMGALMSGQYVESFGAKFFYQYRLLNEQEATVYEYIGWRNQPNLQQAVVNQRQLYSSKMRALEQLIFVR